MQIRAEQLAAALERQRPALVTLYGDEPLLVQEAADLVRAWARREGFDERQVHTVSGGYFDWSRLTAAAVEMSLFAARQLVEIRIPGGKPGKEGSEALQRYTRAGNEDLLSLVLLPRLDKTQLGSAWFTALDGAGLSVRIDPIERRQLPTWIAQRLAAQGQRVQAGEPGQQALALLADRVEGNLLAAHQEIQKLGLLYPAGELTLAQIEPVVLDVARYDVFRLGETVLSGQVARALRMLDGLEASGEAVVLAHWTLADDLRMLGRVRAALDGGLPLGAALREARVWGAKEKLVERLVPGLRLDDLKALIEAARVCDGLAKGLKVPGWPDDPWQALRRLVLMMLETFQPSATRPLVLRSFQEGSNRRVWR
jgi:DNA polymerase-3 subunit delta